MIGLVILGVLVLYLLLSWAVVRWAIKSAKAQNKNPKLWGGVAALVMYLLVFWDHIPTIVSHKYYCATEAGFWVYKTPEQWTKENPGVMETLVSKNRSRSDEFPSWPKETWKGRSIYQINSRFGVDYVDHLSSADEEELFVNVWRWKTEVVDTKTGEVLARKIDFSSGDGRVGGEIKGRFWLQSDQCSENNESGINLQQFIQTIKGGEDANSK